MELMFFAILAAAAGLGVGVIFATRKGLKADLAANDRLQGEITAGLQLLAARRRSELAQPSKQEAAASVAGAATLAAEGHSLTTAAKSSVQRGDELVSQAVATMDQISQSSRRIADLIGAIDGIAFQTNILALNAAVEAARAGEQGRGFAVVASEVRALAQRSAGAAKEIKVLISKGTAGVEADASRMNEASNRATDMVGSVQRVADIISEISSAAREQSYGVAEVNLAISQIDQATQQNAALVEESAAAAKTFQEQVRKLQKLAGSLKVG